MKRLSRKFPSTRSRRLRKNHVIRDLVSDVTINKSKLIQPLFVSDENSKNIDLDSMPGQKLFSRQGLIKEIDILLSLGINTVAIFPNLSSVKKDITGSEAINPDNFICETIKTIKDKFPELVVISDVALDPYTSTGHDGIVINNYVDNDETLKMLQKMSINLAASGSDILAPSDMMDGRIGAIRSDLEAAGHKDTILLSYSSKFSSNFYGPFREAVGSKRKQGISKKTYQMDYRNSKEALMKAEMDINEGADILMVKPAMPNSDIIHSLSENYSIPIFAYQVSGEYSMIQLGIDKKIFDNNVIDESLITLFRAGAKSVLTYYAKWMAKKYD